MKWNVDDIAFLYPPDVFTGSFDNEKMQARHEQQMQRKLDELKAAIDGAADPLEAMSKLHKNDHIQFLLNNQGLFQDADRFEEAVLFLYGRFNAPFASGGDSALWDSLFAACDTTRLYNLGELVPFSSATVYRGSVSGKKRSLSWTPDRQRAERFADRWKDSELGGGELYEVNITKGNILLYRKSSREDEVLLSPEFIKSAEIRTFVV